MAADRAVALRLEASAEKAIGLEVRAHDRSRFPLGLPVEDMTHDWRPIFALEGVRDDLQG